jgi:hypothetical protein
MSTWNNGDLEKYHGLDTIIPVIIRIDYRMISRPGKNIG